MKWLKEWGTKTREIIASPKGFYEQIDRKDNYSYPVKFAVTSGIVAALLIFIVQELQILLPWTDVPAMGVTGVVSLAIFLATGMVGGTLGLFLNSAFVHIFVKIFGFKGFEKTTEAVSYPTSIGAVFGWIPLVNFLAFFYIMYAEIRGIDNFHDMGLKKATASVILSFLLAGLLLFLLLFLPLFFFGAETVAPAMETGAEAPLEVIF